MSGHAEGTWFVQLPEADRNQQRRKPAADPLPETDGEVRGQPQALALVTKFLVGPLR